LGFQKAAHRCPRLLIFKEVRDAVASEALRTPTLAIAFIYLNSAKFIESGYLWANLGKELAYHIIILSDWGEIPVIPHPLSNHLKSR
jgi:hypothetical protein